MKNDTNRGFKYDKKIYHSNFKEKTLHISKHRKLDKPKA